MMAATARSVSETELNILAALEEHGNRMTFPRRELAAFLARWGGSFSASRPHADPGARHHLPHAAVTGRPGHPLQDSAHGRLSAPTLLMRCTITHHLVCVTCGRIDEFRPSRGAHASLWLSRSESFWGTASSYDHRCESCRKGPSVSLRRTSTVPISMPPARQPDPYRFAIERRNLTNVGCDARGRFAFEDGVTGAACVG